MDKNYRSSLHSHQTSLLQWMENQGLYNAQRTAFHFEQKSKLYEFISIQNFLTRTKTYILGVDKFHEYFLNPYFKQ